MLDLFPISSGDLNLLDCMASCMGSKRLTFSSWCPLTGLTKFGRSNTCYMHVLPNVTLPTMMQNNSLP